jgi:predicted acyl esterase
VQIFVMGDDVWREEEAWPLARAVETRYHLHADGLLSPGRPRRRRVYPDSYFTLPVIPR